MVLSKSFKCLNITQFLGALNDNIFKMFIIFALISIKGAQASDDIVALAGAVFVVPFLLFSIQSGVFADRFSKRNIIIFTKSLELLVMLAGMSAFIIKSELMLYTTLFLMATQSTIFGPSKYGIIPELESKENILRANSLISLYTYLAIIIGTFFAAFITDITNKNFIFASGCCVIISVLGLISGINIHETPAMGCHKKNHPFFFVDIFRTLIQSKQTPFLPLSIYSSAYFLFIGAFVQLSIIPYSIFSLGLSDIAGGYLFLLTAIGIGIGSFIAGKVFDHNPNLKIIPWACLGIALSCFCIQMLAFSLVLVAISLVAIGIFGGLYLIPIETYIQIKSPPKNRSRNIATANFLSFVGVLVASGFIAFYTDILKITPRQSYGIIGIVTMVWAIILMLKIYRKRN